MVEVVTALPADETVVTTASVVTGTLEPPTPPAPEEAAAAAPPAVTPTATLVVSSASFSCHSRSTSLTRADGDTVGRNSGIDISTASLVGTVAKTVTETRVSAEAGNIGRAATEAGGIAEQVVDAHLTACWDTEAQLEFIT
jgi:hypothetical protein